MNAPGSEAPTGPTELVLYLTPGNVCNLFRVPAGVVIPLADLLTPPSAARAADHKIPVDLAGPTWKVQLTECVYEFGDHMAKDRRRVRVLYPKGQPPPSKEWSERAVMNTIHTVHPPVEFRPVSP